MIQCFKIISNDKDTNARIGEFSLNGYCIETPILWLGHNLKGPLLPWSYPSFDVQGIIVNACQVLERKQVRAKIQFDGIKQVLKFDGPVMLDSGGFRFQNKSDIEVTPAEIVGLYKESQADIGVLLDHPLDPSKSDRENDKRWKQTVKNAEAMLRYNAGILLMPVVHGYTLGKLKLSCQQIRALFNNPQCIGVGSLVPLI